MSNLRSGAAWSNLLKNGPTHKDRNEARGKVIDENIRKAQAIMTPDPAAVQAALGVVLPVPIPAPTTAEATVAGGVAGGTEGQDYPDRPKPLPGKASELLRQVTQGTADTSHFPYDHKKRDKWCGQTQVVWLQLRGLAQTAAMVETHSRRAALATRVLAMPGVLTESRREAYMRVINDATL